MDPVSFAASLVTISSVVSTSCEIVYRFCSALNNAPEDVERLAGQLSAFEGLLHELNTQLQDHPNFGPSQETLRDLLDTSMKLMLHDVDSLHGVLTKLQRSIDKKLLLSVRAILSEKQIARYQQRIIFHCEALTNIQAIVCARKLDALRQDTDRFREQIDAACRTLSSHLSLSTDRLSIDIQSGFSNSRSQLTRIDLANQTRHRDIISRFDAQAQNSAFTFKNLREVTGEQLRAREVSEAGFQAIHAGIITAATSDQEGHRMTHDSLNEHKDLLQQIIRNQIAFGPTRLKAGASRGRPLSERKSEMMTTVLWNYPSYMIPVGKLNIQVRHTLQNEDSQSLASPRTTEASIAVEFIPPRWFCQAVIQYSIKVGHTLNKFNGFRWHSDVTLNCMTINNDPSFIKAVRNADVKELRNAFEQGLARPTDYIIDDKALVYPWYKNYNFFACRMGYRWLDLFPLFEYLVDSRLTEQGAELLSEIGCRLNVKPTWLLQFGDEDRYSLLSQTVDNYLDQSGLTIPDAIHLMVSSEFSCLEWIPRIITRLQEPLVIEDLEPMAICLISLVANEDRSFRTWLKHEVASYRSPCDSHHAYLVNMLFESTFGPSSLTQHFAALDSSDKFDFLMDIARHGSCSTFELLPENAVRDFGSGCIIGTVAARGRIDIVRMLIEAGASSVFDLRSFLRNESHGTLPDNVFRDVLIMLLDSARPSEVEDNEDRLGKIIKSKKVMRIYPQALNILLDRKIYRTSKGSLLGNPPVEPPIIHGSYIHKAILSDLPSVIKLLLQHGAALENEDPTSYTSSHLISAVLHGRASCADVLIQHGADVISRDLYGTSAVQAAKSNAVTSHPRLSPLTCLHYVSAEADAEVLAVVERAFNSKYQGTRNFEDDTDFEESLPPVAQQRFEEKSPGFLENFLTPRLPRLFKRSLKDAVSGLHQPWHTILQDLVVRFFYVSSYIIVLIVEAHALLKGRRRAPMPSRQVVSAFVVMLLAIVYGSSWLGL